MQYILHVHGKRAKLLCELLLPYLRVKRQQAELIVRFPCDRRAGGGVRLGPDIIALRQSLRDAMTVLNRRGPEREADHG